jgi:hypothetical protein
MKNFVFAAVAAACLFVSSNAMAQANWDNRSTAITADSGVVSRRFKNVELCEGEWDAWNTGILTTCPGGNSCVKVSKRGYNPAYTQTCCRAIYICAANGERLSDEQIATLETNREDLGKVFNPDVVDVYWGYVSSTNRSPNAGRAQSAYARLDVCMGANDTDAAIATMNANTCYSSYCGTSANEYCNANSAAVCQDRCECSINGQTHSSCNQL